MSDVESGTGALLSIMDLLKQICRDKKAAEMKKLLEEDSYDEKGCYRKVHGVKGYGYGQAGPALMSADIGHNANHVPKDADTSVIKAAPGQGCPRCGGEVFHAEQMFSKGRVYHKKCFKCKQCKKPLDSMLCCDGPDREIYCKACYAKIFGAKGYGYGGGKGFLQSSDLDGMSSVDRPHLHVDTQSIPGEPGTDEDVCPRCGGKVFHAEKMLSKKKSFHKPCFSCRECKRPLDSTLCCDAPDGDIYCKPCYGKIFGPKGYGYGGGSMPALLAPSHPAFNADERIQVEYLPGGKNGPVLFDEGCPRCGNPVYEAEKLIAAKKAWHKRCFICGNCGKHLDSTTVNDGQDGNIYCKACYGQRFGMRGYGFGAGAGTLTTGGAFGERIAAESAFILP